MKKEDLDALASLYEGVYSPTESGEYLSEEYLYEQGGRSSSSASQTNQSVSGAQLLYGPSGRPQSPSSRPTNVRGGGTRPATTSSATQSRFAGSRDAAIAKARQIQGSPVVGPGSTARPAATTPASAPRPSATPAARPATPGAGAKVAPTAAAKPTPASTKPAGSAMDQWAAANPKLAAAKAERDRTRGTSATTNPLMKDFKDKLPAPKAPSPTTTSTAFAKPTPALGSSSAPVQSAGSASAAKPTTNQTATAFSSPSLARPTPSTTPIKKPGSVMSSFEWGSKATLKDVADAYSSIYEAKKKDQDGDKDTDFADVQIARMIASGMSRAEAIAAVKNKPYNEEVEIDEATRMRKELGKEGETATRKELAARSKAYKRSGSVDKTIAAAERGADRPYIKHKRDESDADRKKREEKQSRTLRGLAAARRGSVRDNPRAGMRGYAAKVEGSDKDLQTARQRAMSAGTLTPKEKKQLGEDFELWVESLIEEGYDLSEYTWDEMFDIYEAEGSYGETPKAYSAARKTKMTAKRKPFLKAMLRRTNPAERKDAYGSPRKGLTADDRERARAGSAHGVGTRADHDYPSEGPGGVTKNPKKLRKQKAMGEFAKEEYQIYEIVASYLLENNFAETIDDANVIIENMSEVWIAEILENLD